MIFSCQINKRGRLAPASALRSSTSAAAAAAALGGPGWKPPARPRDRSRALHSSQGRGQPGPLRILELQTPLPLPNPGPPPGGQFASAPATLPGSARGGGGAPGSPSSPPGRCAPSVLVNLGDLQAFRVRPPNPYTKTPRREKEWRCKDKRVGAWGLSLKPRPQSG